MFSNMHAKARALLISFLYQGFPFKTVSGGQLQHGELAAIQLLFPGRDMAIGYVFQKDFLRMESKNQGQGVGRHKRHV